MVMRETCSKQLKRLITMNMVSNMMLSGASLGYMLSEVHCLIVAVDLSPAMCA